MDEEGNEKELNPLYQGLISRLKSKPPEVTPEFTNRISIRDGVFTCIEEESSNIKCTVVEGVILTAAPVSRTYYPNTYNPEAHTKPVCWSSDTRNSRPDEEVGEKQSNNCLTCEKNIKGSGEGNSRACRFHQRIAFCFVEEEGFTPKVYQLQLPATSVFGKDPHKMCMQAYLKHLRANSAPLVSVVTNISFDKSSNLPRLVFNPVRPLTEEELAVAVQLKDDPSTQSALLLSSKSKSPFAVQEGFIYANNEDLNNG
jgi:hypothetical protein